MVIKLISILLYQNQSFGEAFFYGGFTTLLFSGVVWLISKIHKHRDERKEFDTVTREETFGTKEESIKSKQTNSKTEGQNEITDDELPVWLFVLAIMIIILPMVFLFCVD